MMSELVTVEWLEARGACPEQVATFRKEWGESVLVTWVVLLSAVGLGLDVEWWLRQAHKPIYDKYLVPRTLLFGEYRADCKLLDNEYPAHKPLKDDGYLARCKLLDGKYQTKCAILVAGFLGLEKTDD